MPEFHIDLGNNADTWHALDEFTRGYVEAAFFTESGDNDLPCNDKSLSDLAPSALAEMKADCADFQSLAQAELAQAYLTRRGRYLDPHDPRGGYYENQAGTDFWFTRNRHGAGFWDRGLGDVGDKLTDHAHSCGEVYLYVGDDGMIYQG